MKITRISRTKAYRIFRDFTWPNTLPDFSRFNLVYGWNGAGKTSLSNLFSHLQRKEAVSEGDIRFRVDGREVAGSDIPTAAMPDVRVFNRNTIDRSVFEKPDGTLPPVYYLGEDSAEKQKRIEQLKAALQEMREEQARLDRTVKAQEKEFEQFCKEQAASIKNFLTSSTAGTYFNSYDAQKFKKKMEGLLSQPQRCFLKKKGLSSG